MLGNKKRASSQKIEHGRIVVKPLIGVVPPKAERGRYPHVWPRNHKKRQRLMGRGVVVAITKGKLDFGPWEQIFYGEFDGNRPKRVLVKTIGK